METPRWLSSTIRNARNLFGPIEPEPAVVQAARKRVEAATAQIADAYDRVATTFAIRDQGRDYLITSAHLTTTRHDASRGFNYEGNQYFLIGKGTHVAFAEQLAFTPQASLCTAAGVSEFKNSFNDLALLHLVSPAETRNMLLRLSFEPKTRAALAQSLSHIPGLGTPLADERFTEEELAKLTEGFKLVPIPVVRKDHASKRTPSAYSIGHQNNVPEFSLSTTTSLISGTKNLHMKLDPRAPIIQGHSGSLLYDVNDLGTISLLGVTASITGDCKQGTAIPFNEVLRGIDRLNGGAPLPRAELAKICAFQNVQNGWFDGKEVVATDAPTLPVSASIRNVAKQAQLCRRP